MKRKSGTTRRGSSGLDILLAPPSTDDLVRLLGAWRLWLLGGLLGALLGVAAYAVAPPPYRARSSVNVDFHLEQAWPQNTDREQFYYLERETRKLIEIAWSDATLERITEVLPAITVEELRAGAPARLHLSQPGNGGWNFFADHRESDAAAQLAGAWARAFQAQVRQELEFDSASPLERFITVTVTQAEALVPERQLSLGLYVLVGAGLAVALLALAMLAIRFR